MLIVVLDRCSSSIWMQRKTLTERSFNQCCTIPPRSEQPCFLARQPQKLRWLRNTLLELEQRTTVFYSRHASREGGLSANTATRTVLSVCCRVSRKLENWKLNLLQSRAACENVFEQYSERQASPRHGQIRSPSNTISLSCDFSARLDQ